MNSPKRSLNRKQVEMQFDRAAATYDSVGDLQRRMGDQLLNLICESPVDKGAALIDLGCGTGELLRGLSNAGFKKLSGLDLSAKMLELAKEKTPSATLIHGDIEQTGCKDESFQAVVSNAALQWCDLRQSFAELHRILHPNGLAFVNVFVAGTLAQWEYALASIGAEPRVHELTSAEDVDFLMSNTRFRTHLIKARNETAKFDSVKTMLDSIRRLGATNATNSRSKSLNRETYHALKDHFQQLLDDHGSLELDFVWVQILATK